MKKTFFIAFDFTVFSFFVNEIDVGSVFFSHIRGNFRKGKRLLQGSRPRRLSQFFFLWYKAFHLLPV